MRCRQTDQFIEIFFRHVSRETDFIVYACLMSFCQSLHYNRTSDHAILLMHSMVLLLNVRVLYN